jgi:hypothetical protein
MVVGVRGWENRVAIVAIKVLRACQVGGDGSVVAIATATELEAAISGDTTKELVLIGRNSGEVLSLRIAK